MIEDLMMLNLRAKADLGITKEIRGVSTVEVIGPVKSVPVTDTHLRTVAAIRSIMKINAQNVLLMGESFTTPLSSVDLSPPPGTLHQNQINRQFPLIEMKT